VSILGEDGYIERQNAWWRLRPGDQPFWTQRCRPIWSNCRAAAPPRATATSHCTSSRARRTRHPRRPALRLHKGDLVLVHTDSVQQHFNPLMTSRRSPSSSGGRRTWLFAGLMQQGSRKPFGREDEFGPREDWSCLWTPGVTSLKKVVGKDRGLAQHAPETGAHAVRASGPTSASSVPTSSSSRSRRAPGRASIGTWPTRRSTSRGGLLAALRGAGRDRREVPRPHRQGADPPRDRQRGHALRPPEHRGALPRRHVAVVLAVGAEPGVPASRLRPVHVLEPVPEHAGPPSTAAIHTSEGASVS
jgi:hypothetical protein